MSAKLTQTGREKSSFFFVFSDNMYMKYTIHTLTITTFFIVSPLLAGPEKYDPLEAYKLTEVEKTGPAREVVLDMDGNQIAEAMYTYNEKGQLVESNFLNGNEPDGSHEYLYDEKGLASEKLYNTRKKLVEEVVYTRDKQGRIIRYSVLDDKGKEIIVWKFEYKNDKLVAGKRYVNDEITEYFLQEQLTPSETMQYIYADDDETVGSIKITYRDNRVVSRFKTDLTGTYEIRYLYSEDGNLNAMEFYSKTNDEMETEMKLQKTHRFFYEAATGKNIKASNIKAQSAAFGISLK